MSTLRLVAPEDEEVPAVSSSPSRPPLPIGHLTHKRQWDIQVATVGLSPLAQTIRVGITYPDRPSSAG